MKRKRRIPGKGRRGRRIHISIGVASAAAVHGRAAAAECEGWLKKQAAVSACFFFGQKLVDRPACGGIYLSERRSADRRTVMINGRRGCKRHAVLWVDGL